MALDLQGGVSDPESIAEERSEGFGVVLGLVDGLLATEDHVGGNGGLIGADGPHMHVMDFLDAFGAGE